MFNTKKTEVVYCRFSSAIYELVKDRAESWGISNAEAIQRLCFVGGMTAWALEQSMPTEPDPAQEERRLGTERLLNAILGPVRSE